MGKSIAVYARVSSRAQDYASQLADLKHWAAAYDGTEPIVWYQETFTGLTMRRPQWQRIEAAINVGRISKVVVWRLDRLGRTASGLVTLFEQLRERRVGLLSLKEALDLETPAGRLMANVLASVAAFENEVRRERILAGQAAARARGKRWGGSKKGRRLKVTAEQVESIRSLRTAGKSIAAIGRATGLSRPTIYRILEQAAAITE